eukprot:m.455022 g.455022  ORF g.455022 m.455022 type:complete len:594 (+) comp20794_c0_seq1:3318-5099(+)
MWGPSSPEDGDNVGGGRGMTNGWTKWTPEVLTDSPDDGSGGSDVDDGQLMHSLKQLQHNFTKLQLEKKSMQKYCEEMEETIDKKEEMVNTLRQHNHALNRKLSAAQVGTEDAEADREIAARKEEARVRRKRRLPAVPKGRYVPKPADRGLADSTIADMVEKIHNLEDLNARLKVELHDARAMADARVMPVDEDDSNRDSVRSEMDQLTAESLREELDAARQDWEKEKAALMAQLQESDREFADLQVALTEAQDLLEETSSQLRSTEMELELEREHGGASAHDESTLSLSDELERSVSLADDVRAMTHSHRASNGSTTAGAGEVPRLQGEVDQLQVQLEVVREEREDACRRLEELRARSVAEKEDLKMESTLLGLQLAELQEAFDKVAQANLANPASPQLAASESATQRETAKKKGMTISEQTALFKGHMELKMELDETREHLIDAKADAAKAQWSQEMEALYLRNRDRVIIQILERPSLLSYRDKRKVVEFLKATTLSSDELILPPTPERPQPPTRTSPLRRCMSLMGGTTPASTSATDDKDAPSGRGTLTKAQIGAPIASSFRKLTKEEAVAQMKAQGEAAKLEAAGQPPPK